MRSVLVTVLILSLGLGLMGLTFASQEKKSGSTSGKDSATKTDDTKDDSPAKPRLRGQLPANYRKLSLTQEQVQKIYKIQAGYDEKLSALEDQIKHMKADEKKEIEGVLTTAQKARLKEILTENAKDK